jgi:hypothetical protein
MPTDTASARAALPPPVQRDTFARTVGQCISCRGPCGDRQFCDTCSTRTLESAGRFLQRSLLCETCHANRGYWRTCDDCFARARQRNRSSQ